MMGISSTQARKARSVHAVSGASDASMGRMPLKRIIQGDHQRLVSPFYIMDEFGPMQLPRGVPFRVDVHPHAGIIPTTFRHGH